jgi:cobalt-zinc-cadmium efflux system outer membrane protein
MQVVYISWRFTLLVALGLSLLIFSPRSFSAPESDEALRALSSFFKKIERGHPRVQSGQADLDASKARLQAASKPLYNPTLELDAELMGLHKDDTDTLTLGIVQTFDWHDKRGAKRDVAKISQQIISFEKEVIYQQLITDIFSALAGYQIQRELIQVLNKRLLLNERMLSQANQRYKVGDISRLDVEQIRLSLTKAELVYNEGESELNARGKILAEVTGEMRKVWPLLPLEPPQLLLKKTDFDSILSTLPGIKAEYARVLKERSTVRLKVLEKKPDPTIGLRVGGENSNGIIGLSFSIPLNIRNTFQAEVDEAEAHLRRAESELLEMRHVYWVRLKSSAQAYQLAYSGWQSWQKIVGTSVQKQGRLLMRFWKVGELSTSDYLVQLNQLKEAEIDNVKLKENIWKAWFSWLAISSQFNKWLNGEMK